MASSGQSDHTTELQPLPAATPKSESVRDGGDAASSSRDSTSPLDIAMPVVEKWNSNPTNTCRLLATFWAFMVMGGNDAAYGLETYYGLNYTIVSFVFFSPLGGYAAAALLNNWIHNRFGQRGVAFLGPFCHLIAYIGIATHPPYPALIVFFLIAGFANGIEDAAWNAWIGKLANPNELLGLLHGLYGVGAVLSPLIATSLITKAGWGWWSFYYLMVGAATLELTTSVAAFWGATSLHFKATTAARPPSNDNNGSSNSTTKDDSNSSGSLLKEALRSRVSWVAAIFLLGYVGVEVALGGWIVVFMTRQRDGGDFESGMVATGFWIGITAGRVALGFVTPRIGEKLAVAIYVPAAIGFQLLFWLVPQFVVSAVAVAVEGFFLGPLFPAAVVATTKLLPAHLHVSAIGFAAAFGGSGAAIFPFAVGVLAQTKGVQVLQPVIVALLAALLIVWAMMPRMHKTRSTADEDAEEGNVSSTGRKSGSVWRNVSSYTTRSRKACATVLKVR
ncbi:major facilitator superfamily [Diplodia corticola]|uniref:Major facilitator superfamily n=1 Tax=Diplodia corticola TaxID=236234 RepID=A0A1J9R1E8_9PEZI|nr:major facilitator superfamily [Diplodia corticola]OJD34448.1 major facilitator superfamily [Diplodia corticola]